MGGKGKVELVIKVTRSSLMESLPVGSQGRGRLLIHKADRAAVKELVDSILLRPSRQVGRAVGGAEGQTPLPGAVDPQRARMDVLVPAAGLLLTGVLALLAPFVFIGLASATDRKGVEMEIGIALLVPLLTVAALLLVGAVRMMRLSSYPLAVVAAFLAMLPLHPAWLLGLGFGIWSLIVLRRREVMAAFLGNRPQAAPLDAPNPAPQRRVVGKIRSLCRSVGRYFFATAAGNPAASADGHKCPPSSPGKTIDYAPGE
jgi:hypothetical protein